MLSDSVIKTCDKLININNYIRELLDDPIMSNRNNNDDLRIFQRVSCLEGLSFELYFDRYKLLVYNKSNKAVDITNTIINILYDIEQLRLEYNINNNLIDNIHYYDYLPSLQSLCSKLTYILLDLRRAISQLNENEVTYLWKCANEASWGNSYSDAPFNHYVITNPFIAYTIAQYILDRPEEQQHTTYNTTKADMTGAKTIKEESKLTKLDQKAYDLQQQLQSPLPHNITLETLYTNIPPRTDYDDFRCVLGQGVLCHTYRKQNSIDNMIYAVKVIRERDVRSNYLNFDTIYTEALALQAINHMYIVRHLVVFKSYNNELINIVMELVDGSSLAKYTQNTTATTAADRPSKELLTKWLLQTLRALQFLHDDMHILHRDIKPDNILITSSQQDIKLIGIDLATIACSSLYNNILCVSLYASLEKADNYEYDGRDDVWAVGCIWTELLTGVSLQQRGVILCRPQSAAVLAQIVGECIVYDATLGAVVARMLVASDVDRATASECIQRLTDGTQHLLTLPPLTVGPYVWTHETHIVPPQSRLDFSMPHVDFSMPHVDYSMPIDELDDCMPHVHFRMVPADEQDYSYLAYDIAAMDLSSIDPLVDLSDSPVGYTYSNPVLLSAADEPSSSSQSITQSSLATNSPLDNTLSYEPVALPLQAPTVSLSLDPISGPLISPPVQNQLPGVPLFADKSTVSRQPYRVPPKTLSAAVVASDSRPRRRLIGLDKGSSERSNSSSDSLVADGTEVQTEVEGTESVDMINEEQTDEANVVSSNTVVKSIAQTTSSSADTITATADSVIPVHEMSIAKAEEILIDIYSISNTELWQLRCLNDYLIKLLEVGYGGGKSGWTQMDLVRFFRGEPQQVQGQGHMQAPVVADSSGNDGAGGGEVKESEGNDKSSTRRGQRDRGGEMNISPKTPIQGISHVSPKKH